MQRTDHAGEPAEARNIAVACRRFFGTRGTGTLAHATGHAETARDERMAIVASLSRGAGAAGTVLQGHDGLRVKGVVRLADRG